MPCPRSAGRPASGGTESQATRRNTPSPRRRPAEAESPPRTRSATWSCRVFFSGSLSTVWTELLSVCAIARHLGAPKPRPSHLGGEARAGQNSPDSPQPGSHVFTWQLNAETPTCYPKCVRQCRDTYHITCKVLVLSPFSDVLGTSWGALHDFFFIIDNNSLCTIQENCIHTNHQQTCSFVACFTLLGEDKPKAAMSCSKSTRGWPGCECGH